MNIFEQVWRVAQTRLGAARPVYAHYGVTHRCTMRCRMCIVWQSADRSTELSPPEVEPLAAGLHDAGVRTVAIGGGEPFVRGDLPEVIAAFRRRGMEVRLLTNGIGLSDEAIRNAVDAGTTHVSVSLDTLDAAREKSIYDGHDVWEQIVHSMRRFRRALPRDRAVPVMNVCVSKLNAHELPELVDFAVAEGYVCSFVPITLAPDETSSDGFAGVAPDLAFSRDDHARLEQSYAALLKRKRRGAPIVNSSRFLRDSLQYLMQGRVEWECDAGRLYFSVSPQGGISICHRYEPVARFDTKNLGPFLRSDAVRRAARQQRRNCPGCMRPCWAEVTHAMHDARSGFEAWRVLRGRSK